jgi:UDP-N-acetylmuramoyl-tripeptide--D-alanyl-D-alanine ligase
MELQKIYELYTKHPVITTDSRNCPKDSIFFALKGEKFNGNKFASETIQKGCAFAFVDEKEYANEENIFLVEDTLKTLQDLARLHRQTLNTPIIAITGTNGKTTTKELTASVLKKNYKLLYTQGNLNNHIGVPLTILQLKKEHSLAIIEMGANHPGEIRTLANIACPNYGVITNIGKAHIEGFGSLDGVIHTKCELYDYLNISGGKAFVNQSNEILQKEADKRKLSVIKYANENSPQIVSCEPFLTLSYHDKIIETQLIGRYNLENILAAIKIGEYFEVGENEIIEALKEYCPNNNRSQFKKTQRNELIIDAYNANPTSMKASLENFLLINNGQKSVILGDMKELGHDSKEEHQKIADLLSKSDLENIILVGPCFEQTVCPAAKKFTSTESLKNHLTENPISSQLILIKGSNSMKLVECIELL